MIISNTEGQPFASFNPAYISKDCKLPSPQITMTNEWINSLSLDYIEYAKKMMIVGKQFCQKSSNEYETAKLRTPYILISLMLSRIYGRENRDFYKMSWIPLVYHMAIQGTIFNWDDIVANNLSSCIVVAEACFK